MEVPNSLRVGAPGSVLLVETTTFLNSNPAIHFIVTSETYHVE